MSLITLNDAHLAYGHTPLLDGAGFSLEEGERVGLIGRNGAGKSSLLKILAGIETADSGALRKQQGLRIIYVAQEPQLDKQCSVFEAVAGALKETRSLIEQYERGEGDLDTLQTRIELLDGWSWAQRVDETLSRLQLNPHASVASLSGGTAKRVALAQGLVAMPHVLLLDEPTNHLDLDSILWLEELLLAFKGSLVTITHDRSFLDRVATRIVEMDRGHLNSYPGNFQQYQLLKEEQMRQEAMINERADKLLAQEEIWIRKGVEARRTRSQSRVTRLQALRAQHAQRRQALGRAKLDIDSGLPSGKLVAELTQVSHAFGSTVIARKLDLAIARGDKIGLVGPNGVGKSTLLKIILGEITPNTGQVRRGSHLQIAYFDQMRDNLSLDATLEDFISPGSEWIEIGGQRKHVKSYLGDFLFPPQRAHAPVRSLSGGERNRLLLARLFARPANVLVLDEPTNDLDIDTLELLEELLQSYDGTVFIVSHDRSFLDQVVTSTLVYEGSPEAPGQWREYEGGIQDWLTQWQRSREIQAAAAAPRSAAPRTVSPSADPPSGHTASTPSSHSQSRKLSYKEQRELDTLPERIAALETEQQGIRDQLADGQIYVNDPTRAAQLHQRDADIEEALLAALERWQALSP